MSCKKQEETLLTSTMQKGAIKRPFLRGGGSRVEQNCLQFWAHSVGILPRDSHLWETANSPHRHNVDLLFFLQMRVELKTTEKDSQSILFVN